MRRQTVPGQAMPQAPHDEMTNLYRRFQRLDERCTALLIGAVLTCIKNVELRQVAVRERAANVVAGSAGWGGANRHVLVPELVAGALT
jgi:hypothetical protein